MYANASSNGKFKNNKILPVNFTLAMFALLGSLDPNSLIATTFLVPSVISTKNWSVSQIGYGCPLRWKKRTVKIIVPPTTCGSVQSQVTLQLAGSKYFPVTYCSKECRASGASDGWVIAANVTRPATETDTTNIPPHVQASLILKI